MMDIKRFKREFAQIFEAQAKRAGCLKCNGHGEIAVQDGGKFKSVACGCDERKSEYTKPESVGG